MPIYPATTEYVRNVKTGSVGQVICRYVDTFSGKAKVHVRPVSQLKDAYWLAAHVVAH